MQVAAAQISTARATPTNDGSAIARPDPATLAAQKQQVAKAALATLAQSQSSQKDVAKSQAKEKVEQLKERIKMLRMMCAGDPKALAKMVAGLSKELAAAVKQYTDAGGTDSVSADAAPADTTSAAASDAPKDAEANPETTTQADDTAQDPQTGATAAAPSQTGDAAQKSDAYQKMVAGLEKQSQILQAKSADAKDSTDFMTQVRSLANQLKTYLKHAATHLDKAQQNTNTDVADADKALKEVDKAVNESDAAAASVKVLGAALNISA